MSGQEPEKTFDSKQVYDCELANKALVELSDTRTRSFSQTSANSVHDFITQDEDDIDALLNDLRKLINSSTGGTKKNPSIRTHLPLGKVEEGNRLLDLLEMKLEGFTGGKIHHPQVEKVNKEVQVDTPYQQAQGTKSIAQKESHNSNPLPSFAQVVAKKQRHTILLYPKEGQELREFHKGPSAEGN
ncbi:hypothetical protein AVEN_123915-1 [Araneus ventricosus]|uniref:Uncharacterized protein n=1 Tax=Araneus ventricosus TaxID=182803 RepID=A0A4Y2U9N0_ARAVE|nr:hypothetical protein AVEN_123915-1 [Araneus ventricosus]